MQELKCFDIVSKLIISFCISNKVIVRFVDFSKYGFLNYLIDLFDCPDAVMRFLCMQYQVYKIPVGGDKVKSNVDRVIHNNPELHVFYTRDTQVTCFTVDQAYFSC